MGVCHAASGQSGRSRLHIFSIFWYVAKYLQSIPIVGREVHHLMRRLGKAAKYGALFEQLAKEKADDRTALEAEVLFQAFILMQYWNVNAGLQAYAAFLQGSLLLEEEKWELALERLARCRFISSSECCSHSRCGGSCVFLMCESYVLFLLVLIREVFVNVRSCMLVQDCIR